MEKEITTYQLAKIVKDGFKDVKKSFKQIDKQFKQVDQRFEQIDQRFEQVDQRFDQLATATARGFNENDKQHKELRHNQLEIMAEIHDIQSTKSSYVSRFEYKGLVKRIETLEEKVS